MKVYYLKTDGTAVRYNSAEVVRLANMAGPVGLDGTFWFRGVPPSTRGGAWNWTAPDEAIVGIGRFAPCLSFGVSGKIVYQHERLAPADDGYIARFSWARAGFAVYPAQDINVVEEDPIRQVQAALCEAAGAADDWPAAGRQGHLRVLRWFGSTAVKEAAQAWWYALNPEWCWTPRHRVLNHLVEGGADFVIPVRVGEEVLAYVYGRRPVSILSPDHLGERIDLEPGEYLLRHPLPVANVD